MAEVKTRNIHIEALSRSLGAPSLDGLAYALRHPETWPKGFVWRFSECDQCAMGLATALWDADAADRLIENEEWVSYSARLLAMPYAEANAIFLGGFATRPKRFLGIRIGREDIPFEQVTPEMVADAIDAFIARGR